MRTSLLFHASLLILASLTGCRRNAPPVADTANAAPPIQAPAAAPMAKGKVVETFNAANYTYVRIKTDSGDLWAAATPFKVSVGDQVSVPTDMPMENFHSSALNRTFPRIYFTSRIFVDGEPGPSGAAH